MAGVLTDSDARPIVGFRIATEEGGGLTDVSGKFAVPFKAPAQFIHFQWNGTQYYRGYLPEMDDGRVLRVQVPPLGERSVRCRIATACELTLVWELDPTFKAMVSQPCQRSTIRLLNVPAAEPTHALCRNEAGIELPSSIEYVEDGVLVVEPPPREVSIKVVVAEGTEAPSNCDVRLGRRRAKRVKPGEWTVRIGESAAVRAVCEGRPAVPVTVLQDAESASVEWHAEGPSLDGKGVELSGRLHLVSEGDSDEDNWSLDVGLDKEGVWQLPHLKPGKYLVIAGDAGLQALSRDFPASGPEDFELQRVAMPGKGAPDGHVGYLQVEEAVTEGVIKIANVVR